MLVAALLVAGSVGWEAPAGAGPATAAAACTTSTGITVVVDFGTLGGGVQIRCVTQSVTSGFDALRKAGFTYDPTARFGGLLCRINGKPADDPCINAPPSDRYWAYWTAPVPGGSWAYSDQGAGNRVPPPGSVEGWAFSDGCDRKPGSGPCPTVATTTTTTGATTTTSTSRLGGGTSAATSTTVGDAGAGATGDDTTTTTSSGGPTTTADADLAPAAGEAGDEEVAIGGEAAAAQTTSGSDDGGGGSALGVVVGGLVVLALVGATVVTTRRRRSEEAGP